MSATPSVYLDTADKHGLTLADLHGFVQDADRAGVDPRSTLHVRVGFGAQPRAITTIPPKEATR